MFGKRTFIMFLSMFALGTAIDPDNICILVADDSKIVDDSNCAAYYTCKDGKAIASTCPSGYYFNKDKKGCVTKAQATCVTTDVEPCAGVADGKFVSMAGSCSGYYYCKNQIATVGQCPGDLVFNPNKQQCQYKSEYTCTVAGGNSDADTIIDDPVVLCSYVPEGVFFGNAASCNTWHKCKNSALVSGSCGTYVFDVQSQACVYESAYDCQQLNGDSSQTGGTPLGDCIEETVDAAGNGRTVEKSKRDGEVVIGGETEDETEEETEENTNEETDEDVTEEEVSKEPKKYKDPDSCTSYITCVNKKFVRTKCSAGQYFSLTDQKCTTRADAVNKCDRCEGSSSHFVNAYADDCLGYFICSKGKKSGVGSCGKGYYFNEKLGSCVTTKVEYKACLKNSYNTYSTYT